MHLNLWEKLQNLLILVYLWTFLTCIEWENDSECWTRKDEILAYFINKLMWALPGWAAKSEIGLSVSVLLLGSEASRLQITHSLTLERNSNMHSNYTL